MISSNYCHLIEFQALENKAEAKLKQFGFFDHFNLQKREKILKLAKELFFHTLVLPLTDEEFLKAHDLQKRLIKQVSGTFLSDIFLIVFRPSQFIKLAEKNIKIEQLVKKVKRLLELQIRPSEVFKIFSFSEANVFIQAALKHSLTHQMRFFNYSLTFKNEPKRLSFYEVITQAAKIDSLDPLTSQEIIDIAANWYDKLPIGSLHRMEVRKFQKGMHFYKYIDLENKEEFLTTLKELVEEDKEYLNLIEYIAYNKQIEPLFKTMICKNISDFLDKEHLYNWKDDLYHILQQKKAILEVKDSRLKDGYYKRISAEELTLTQFKRFIRHYAIEYKPTDISVWYPKEKTLDQLIDKGIILKGEGNYEINQEYSYSQDGFIPVPNNWQSLRPFCYVNSSKQFTLDIIVYTASQALDPLIFAHAALEITTPNGEKYSVGFLPTSPLEEENLNSFLDRLYLQEGLLESPDPYSYSSKKKHVISYILPDAKAFRRLIKWIERTKNPTHKSGKTNHPSFSLLFHPTYHNCASFVVAARNFALGLGAKPQKMLNCPISKWTKAKIRVKEAMISLVFKSSLFKKWSNIEKGLTEYAGIKNYTVDRLGPKQLYLPIDLILDHMSLEQKYSSSAK